MKDNNRKRILRALFVVTIFFLLSLAIYFQNKPEIDINEDILRVYYFDIGQADCTLIVNNGETMLIDGGNEADSQNLIKYIKKLGVKKLNYVIATHPDTDHIAGLDKVIKEFNIGSVYMPITNKDNKEVRELSNVLVDKEVINPAPQDKFDLGNTKCTILNSGNNAIDNGISDNDISIVLQLDYKNVSLLFTGDAGANVELGTDRKDEDKIIWKDIDILKVSHHGSNTGTTEEFLNQVKPEYSIISVGSRNDYGHPNNDVLDRLKGANSVVYRTDLDGTVILISDGENYGFEFDKRSLDGKR